MQTTPLSRARRAGSRPAALAIALIVAVVVLTVPGCGGSGTTGTRTFVALGDSFAAGEGIEPYDAGTDVLFGTKRNTCHRSLSAYPRVLYVPELLLRHVACSGAELRDLTTAQQPGQPAQLDSVTKATALVTLTIGANDTGAVRALLRCVVAGVTCEAESARVNQAVVNFAAGLPAALDEIHRRAPAARVVVVGYPQILRQDATRCDALGPLQPAERDAAVRWFRAETTSLNGVLRAVASARHGTFVDTEAALAGHELCTPDPWVFPFTPTNLTASFHPNAAGQAALAKVTASEVIAQ